MMRCLKYASLFILLFFAACGNPYKGLQVSSGKVSALHYKPVFTKELYRCVVDGKVLFKRFHLSGLLLFKTFDDGSTRAVFQNEMGFSFFDFRWDAHDSFQVMSIIPQLNKPALVKTLKKDMNLVLMKNLDASSEQFYQKDASLYSRFTLEKGYAYYITVDQSLTRIENAGKSKVITIDLGKKPSSKALPETIFFRHHKAHFTIDLKKLNQDAG